jgi:hypothetical protein
MGDETRRLLIECECGSLDHIARLSVWDDEPLEAYFTFHMKTWRGFWKRLGYSLRYLLGLRQRYGCWDELCLTQRDAAAVVEALQVFLRVGKKKEE